MIDGKYFVIDAHCHIYPEKIAAKAAQSTGNFYGEIPYADGTTDFLLKEGRSVGIDRFVVQSVATAPKQVISINEFIARSVAESNGLMVGLGTLHPDSEDMEGDVRHLKELGLRGVKLHPDIQDFKVDDPKCLKICEICQREALPILMHTGDNRYDNSNPNRVLPILKAYPHLTLIGAHFGGWSVWQQAGQSLAGMPNLYVDCCSSMQYISPEETVELIRLYGADRVLFGTDYPLWSPAKEIENFMALKLTDEERRLILSENAKRVFGI
ncbi:MAG: amidohydrolase [Clostridia bacterium]|nr:amidohydrolase [Clostridia bacterium]